VRELDFSNEDAEAVAKAAAAPRSTRRAADVRDTAVRAIGSSYSDDEEEEEEGGSAAEGDKEDDDELTKVSWTPRPLLLQ
jgi:hypothetical protein